METRKTRTSRRKSSETFEFWQCFCPLTCCTGHRPFDFSFGFTGGNPLKTATLREVRLASYSALLAAVATLTGCGSGSPVTHQANPLVAQYHVSAPAGAQVAVEFGTDTTYGRLTGARAVPAGGSVDVLVAGMKPSTEYHMRAKTTLVDGTVSYDTDRVFHTGAIEMDRLPTFSAQGDTDPHRGIELVNLTASPGVSPGNKIQAVALDLQGNVIWYYDHPSSEGFVFPVKMLRDGNMLVSISDYASTSVLREVDLAGNTISEFTLDQLNSALTAAGFSLHAKFLHHDVLRLPNDHTVVLVAEDRTLNNIAGFPANTLVEGDAIIDLDPNMKPVWVWDTFDHLDINRHPLAVPPDWTHGNALVRTADNNLLFSMRNQHWVIKIDFQDGKGSGNILWRLGNQGDIALTNGDASDWFYGQHYPFIVSEDGNVMRLAVFDDGNDRPDANGNKCGATTTPCYSRAVLYDIDQTASTATVEWEYQPGLFSFWGGSVRVLRGSGNVELDLSQPATTMGSRVLEVTQDATPQLVWQLDISVPNAYRAYRINSLYPGVRW